MQCPASGADSLTLTLFPQRGFHSNFRQNLATLLEQRKNSRSFLFFFFFFFLFASFIFSFFVTLETAIVFFFVLFKFLRMP